MVLPVVIVDDNEAFRFLMRALLRQELGVGCLGLSSLAEVKASAEVVLSSRLVLLDINLGLGKPDGVAVYDWLIGQGYPGKILFLTGHAKGSRFLEKAERTGVPVMEKPMAPEDIILTLRNTLSTPSLPLKQGGL